MFGRIGLGDKPFIEKLHGARTSAPLDPFASARDFLPPLATAPQSPVGAMFAPPRQEPSLQEALEVIGKVVTAVLPDESADFYWRWDSFRTELLALVAAQRDGRREELRTQVNEAIEQGRRVRAEVADLEAQHNRKMMDWNHAESLASQRRAALTSAQLSPLDEFATDAEVAARQTAIAAAQTAANEAAGPCSSLLQDQHQLQEQIARRKRDLSEIRNRLRSLRESLAEFAR